MRLTHLSFFFEQPNTLKPRIRCSLCGADCPDIFVMAASHLQSYHGIYYIKKEAIENRQRVTHKKSLVDLWVFS